MLEALERIIRACRGDPRGLVQMLAADLSADQLERLADLLQAEALLKRGSTQRHTRAFRRLRSICAASSCDGREFIIAQILCCSSDLDI